MQRRRFTTSFSTPQMRPKSTFDLWFSWFNFLLLTVSAINHFDGIPLQNFELQFTLLTFYSAVPRCFRSSGMTSLFQCGRSADGCVSLHMRVLHVTNMSSQMLRSDTGHCAPWDLKSSEGVTFVCDKPWGVNLFIYLLPSV